MPVVALLLTLLAAWAPEITLAPMQAGEPRTVTPRPIDLIGGPTPARAPRTVDERTAGGLVPPSSRTRADAVGYQAALEAARAHADAFGVTFAAVRDGRIVWAGSAGTTREGGRLTAGDPMVVGSVTKTFVAAAVLQLVDEGRVGLDDSVRDYLPALPTLSREVTVRQLLDHTSGLADVFNDTTRRGLEEHPERAWTTAEVLATLREPWYEPGEGWAYANTNYLLLALLVEDLTGAPLAAELERRFFAPHRLVATTLLDGNSVGAPLEPAWSTIFWASGAMTATAGDLARWGDALYGGEVLSRRARAAMLDVNEDDYGLGAQRIELGGLEGFGHTGLLKNYTTLLIHLPAEDVTLALLVNRTHVDLAGVLSADPPGGLSLLELASQD